MTQFTFRLRALLLLRCAERDARRAGLAAALARAGHLADRRLSLEIEMQLHRQQITSDRVSGQIDLALLRSDETYQAALSAQIESISELERSAVAEAERCQDALTPAEAEVRVLEKLRERQHEVARAEQARRQERQNEEWAARASR
jgi:flagellar export protein FliJ